MTKHFALMELFVTLINSNTVRISKLIIDESMCYGIVLADKTAIVPFGCYYKLYRQDEYKFISEVTNDNY